MQILVNNIDWPIISDIISDDNLCNICGNMKMFTANINNRETNPAVINY